MKLLIETMHRKPTTAGLELSSRNTCLQAWWLAALLAVAAAGTSCSTNRPPDLASSLTPAERSEIPDPARAQAGAQAIQGTAPPDWQAERWLNSSPLHLAEMRGKVVLVRWWTSGGCRFYAATAPSLRTFSEKYGPKGLQVIGMYHHKGSEPFEPSDYEEAVRQFEFEFPVAFDPDWRTFHSWMRDSEGNPVKTGWTSVTFVLDKHGVVRHLHPGGWYVKGDPAYKALTTVIEQLLAEG